MVFLYAFIGVLCLGLAPLLGKKVLYRVNPITAFALRTLIAAIIVMPWYISLNGIEELYSISTTSWMNITIEAILAALLGDLAYFMALNRGNAQEVSLIMSSAPLITIVCGYFFFHDVVSLTELVGALLITCGLLLLSLD